ncbi:DUF4265 domain-containing protein [Kitasatospora sp. NPDC088783]|uniref:DUF4265 domain-containing protein n=1 Tax=Kitasatospora sp. NPDC088783 TaxID=3364077 RepID=UPI0037FE51E5
MTPTPQSPAVVHVRLLAGHASSGRPVFEVLPARPLESGSFELAGSPGLVFGCAAGDVLRVGEEGEFEVVERGGNLCVQAYRQGRFTPESFAELRKAVDALDGLAEAPPDLRFVVVTVSRSVGLPVIEQLMDSWAASGQGIEWWIGNGEREDAAP